MFNFRDLIPWPRAVSYQKLSEEMWEVSQVIKKEKQVSKLNDFSFSVGPSFSFEDGVAITFKQDGGLSTTVEMGYIHARTLVDLIETVIQDSGEQDE